MSKEKYSADIQQELNELRLEIIKLRENLQSEYLKPSEAARYLQISEAYLSKLRCRGGGPVFCSLGRRAVRYKKSDLAAWANSFAKAHTSDDGSSNVNQLYKEI